MTIPKAEIKGKMTPVLSGAFNNVSDGIDFHICMDFLQEYNIPVTYTDRYGRIVDLGFRVEQWHLETLQQGVKAVTGINCTWEGNEAAIEFQDQSVGAVVYGGSGQEIPVSPSDFGTAWEPLEKAPELILSYQ